MVLAAAGSVFVAVVASSGRPHQLTVKDRGAVKPFTLANIREGEPAVSLGPAPGRPVVMNFWASWCIPCRQEMPAFEAVHERLGSRVRFLGVNHEDSRGPALKLLEQTGVRYPSGYDPEGNVARSYGLFGMPTTLFISANGRLLERRTGAFARDELEKTIERLFPVASPEHRP